MFVFLLSFFVSIYCAAIWCNNRMEILVVIIIMKCLSFLATWGERLTGVSGDLREMYKLSVIIKHFNLVLIHESFVSADEESYL